MDWTEWKYLVSVSAVHDAVSFPVNSVLKLSRKSLLLSHIFAYCFHIYSTCIKAVFIHFLHCMLWILDYCIRKSLSKNLLIKLLQVNMQLDSDSPSFATALRELQISKARKQHPLLKPKPETPIGMIIVHCVVLFFMIS